MMTDKLGDDCIRYHMFDTPDDYEKFLQSKLSEGFKYHNRDVLGTRYIHADGRMLRCRKDSFDGEVMISGLKKAKQSVSVY